MAERLVGSPLSSASPSVSPAKPAPEAPKSPSEDDDLLCNICREYSAKEVFQCIEGHIFCGECYGKMATQKAICAVCRCNINIDKPIRNRLAEKKILDLPTTCKYSVDGCAAFIPRGSITDHEMRQCQYRPVSCAAASIGCPWRGPLMNERSHEKECMSFQLMPVMKSVQGPLQQRTRQLENEVRDRLAALEPRLEHCAALLTKLDPRASEPLFLRTFDFRLRDPAGPYGYVNTFMAFGHVWELQLTPKSDAVGLRLKHVQQSGSLPPQGRDTHQSLGVFSITVTAMHPSSTELEVGFKYRRVDLTHARYLDEQLWLPAPQLTRHFISPASGILRLKCKMRKHLTSAKGN